MTKKSAKPAVTETPIDMVLSQQAEIEKLEMTLSTLVEKQSAKLTKSLDGIKTKASKAKAKLASDKSKLKEAKTKLKAKATPANEKRVEKCEEALLDSKEKMDNLKQEMDSIKVMYGEMKVVLKKHKARDKALAMFEKDWAKSSVKPKKPAKKNNVKKEIPKRSESKKEMLDEVMLDKEQSSTPDKAVH